MYVEKEIWCLVFLCRVESFKYHLKCPYYSDSIKHKHWWNEVSFIFGNLLNNLPRCLVHGTCNSNFKVNVNCKLYQTTNLLTGLVRLLLWWHRNRSLLWHQSWSDCKLHETMANEGTEAVHEPIQTEGVPEWELGFGCWRSYQAR